MSTRSAVIAGATGLVGRHCLERLLASPAYGRVTAIARRQIARTDARLDVQVVSFDQLASTAAPGATDAFCALGTTIAAAGSRDAFRAVDFDYVTAFARWAHDGGAQRFVLVSSIGADPGAGNFYLRVKGQAERAVSAIGFEQLDVLRPGLLVGARSESRPGEALAQRVMPPLAFMLVGALRKYRPIPAAMVGAAMVGTALAAHRGVRVLEHDLIRSMAESGATGAGRG
jgi:uncharacterized protein YbjT (DUF2867 family)